MSNVISLLPQEAQAMVPGFLRLSAWSTAMLAIILGGLQAAEGPGYPQRSWPALGRIGEIAKNDSVSDQATGSQSAVVMSFMHNGYFFLMGGGESAWDISDPTAPKRKWFKHAGGKKHSIGFLCGTNLCYYGNSSIWDLNDGTQVFTLTKNIPQKNSPIALHNFYQAPYFWFGHSGYHSDSGSIELSSYDAASATAASIKEFTTLRNAWGGKEQSVHVIGNLMVVSTGKQIATVDVGDPLNPKAIDVLVDTHGNYGAGFYNNRVFAGNRCYDVSNPSDIRFVGFYGNDGTLNSTDRYQVGFQHGFLHVAGYKKISTETLRTVYEHPGSGEFALPVGNLAIPSSQGAKIIVHQLEPDRRGPEVMTVNPVNGAVRQHVKSRIGVCLEEWPDASSITPRSFILRKVGGGEVAGTLSCQWTIVNFTPRQPLEANATYELEIPAGGIKDLVGNRIGQRFTARFSTGDTLGGGDDNRAPTISTVADVTITEDASTGPLAFTVADDKTSAGSLVVTASTSNGTLLPPSGIALGGSGGNRTVALTPAANQSGDADITLSVSDGSLSTRETFTLRVTAVNDPPVIGTVPAQTLVAGQASAPISITVSDPETASGSLTVTAISANTGIIPASGLVLGGSGANRTLTITPAAGNGGGTTVTVTVSDGTLSATRPIPVTVSPGGSNNSAPTISPIADRSQSVGAASSPVTFSIGDAETHNALIVSAVSSNQVLLPNAGLVLSGSGANRTLNIALASNIIGSTKVTVTVSDGLLSAEEAFELTITNTKPTITALPDFTIAGGTPMPPMAFTIGDAETPSSLTVGAASSNKALVPQSGLVLSGTGPSRTLTVTPVPGLTGTTTITVTVGDGNAQTSEPFVLTVTPATAPVISGISFSANPVAPGSALTITAQASDADGSTLEYRWDFSDGAPQTGWSPSTSINHTFAARGHYTVVLQVRDGQGNLAASSQLLTVATAPVGPAPTQSAAIAIDESRRRVWSVNRDGSTVTAVDVASRTRVGEYQVGREPAALAVIPSSGDVWVACAGDGTVRVLSASGSAKATISLGYGSDPRGICADRAGANMYVACSGTGSLVRIDVNSRAITGGLNLAPTARAIAISGDGARILVTRFISPDAHGQVWEIAAPALTLTRTFTLALDPGPDSESSGRGLPNYLGAIAISPDGREAWVGGKKDNIQRGLARDGLDLDADNTVRAVIARIDLAANREDPARRMDVDNRDLISGLCFSPLGDWVFASVQGSDEIARFDAFIGEFDDRFAVGAAPQGAVIDAAGSQLFSHDFLGRSVTPVPLGGLFTGTDTVAVPLPAVPTQAVEPLTAQVLSGKRIFYNAIDPRMSAEGYMSCATCHADGGHDGRTWDFTGRGEGLRNTTDLRGRRGTGHGRVHWSANFDEIQDFEHDIRGAFGGTGFMNDADFNSGTRNTPLGDAKKGRSTELDALAAYVTSLAEIPASPHRTTAGDLTSSAAAGRALFSELNCQSCHTGSDFTDSISGALHDVGTIKATSGKRLGQILPGIDTPTIKGLWAGAPYLHDGSAATLEAVFDQGTVHGVAKTLSATERQQLIDFLSQIDDREPAVSPQTPPVAPLRINFQPATAKPVSGWLVDGGRTYGDRGDGRTYGWSRDMSGEARDRNRTSDQLKDTLVHMYQSTNKTPAQWEVALPNGEYSVRLIAGDPSYYGAYNVLAEGGPLLSGTSTQAKPWVEVTATVRVSDGRLTLSTGGSAKNKLCAVEITAVPAGISRALDSRPDAIVLASIGLEQKLSGLAVTLIPSAQRSYSMLELMPTARIGMDEHPSRAK